MLFKLIFTNIIILFENSKTFSYICNTKYISLSEAHKILLLWT